VAGVGVEGSGEAAARADNVVREAAAGGRTAAAVERAAKGKQPARGGKLPKDYWTIALVCLCLGLSWPWALVRYGRRRRSKRAESAAAPIVKVNSVHQTPLASQKHRRHRLLPRQQRRLRPMV
ncbi:unnamed protein product, partial [Pylaiella littoralis]